MDLTEFILILGDGNTSTIEDNEAGARGAGVNGTDESIFQVFTATAFIWLQQRAVAIMCLVGVNVHVRGPLLLLLDKSVKIGHIKWVPHRDRELFPFLLFFFVLVTQ
jgi:hypothetical protein